MAANDYTRTVNITPLGTTYAWDTPPDWITITRVGSSNDWTITVSANSSSARSATLTVRHDNGSTTDTISVSQAGISSGGGAGPTATPVPDPTATPTPTSGSGSGAGPTATPVPNPTPTSGSGSGAGPTPTPAPAATLSIFPNMNGGNVVNEQGYTFGAMTNNFGTITSYYWSASSWKFSLSDENLEYVDVSYIGTQNGETDTLFLTVSGTNLAGAPVELTAQAALVSSVSGNGGMR